MVEIYLVILTAIQFLVILNLINKLEGKNDNPITKLKKVIKQRKRQSKNKIVPVDTEVTAEEKVRPW